MIHAGKTIDYTIASAIHSQREPIAVISTDCRTRTAFIRSIISRRGVPVANIYVDSGDLLAHLQRAAIMLSGDESFDALGEDDLFDRLRRERIIEAPAMVFLENSERLSLRALSLAATKVAPFIGGKVVLAGTVELRHRISRLGDWPSALVADYRLKGTTGIGTPRLPLQEAA